MSARAAAEEMARVDEWMARVDELLADANEGQLASKLTLPPRPEPKAGCWFPRGVFSPRATGER